jgi:hypothetical protein
MGELALEVAVESDIGMRDNLPRVSSIADFRAESGEFTLQVARRSEGGYSFQLLGGDLYPAAVTSRSGNDPAELVRLLAGELSARPDSVPALASPELARRRLQNLGAQLWSDLLPTAIREQFWAQHDRIKELTIADDSGIIPWELLYPVDRDHDDGFLIGQFPVVRRIHGQSRVRRLRLSSVAYIVPPDSPTDAVDEVQAVRERLGHANDMGVYSDFGAVIELLDECPSVLHITCQNTEGSRINLAGGALAPIDLTKAVVSRSLATARPLVFLNVSRSAGETPQVSMESSWAKQFMAAGASVFVSSLWAVPASSARVFADTFYRALIADGAPLGEAALRARRTVATDSGDPSSLAYTVYGHPNATLTSTP